jgi:hypothetical protein
MVAGIVVTPPGSVTVVAGMLVVNPGEVIVVGGWVKGIVTVVVAEQAPAARISMMINTNDVRIKPVFMRFTSLEFVQL